MSYQVLARKWRPRHFQAMVGQEHILRMLINALDKQRLHHAYLFTGTRGVGKTSVARIFAKCLNCETGITSQPCGTCHTCQAIDTGKFLDLIEVDAASRTKVEDTRELLENVQYAPTQGRFKIYLIDEVHMLSGHSFNALLKTLEEPPAHVKFLLATTDPKRLPITILSRCLQFNLKRVSIENITQQLAHICTTEQISFEQPALQLVAEAADGSMRDALSLLDQTIAFCGEKITTADTQNMLGCVKPEAVLHLLDALANKDTQQLFTEITTIAEQSPDFSHLLEALLSALHHISMTQMVSGYVADEKITQLAAIFSTEDVQLYYQIALIGRRDLALAPNLQQGFEMVMLRMLAFQPAAAVVSERKAVVTSVISGGDAMNRVSTTSASGDWNEIVPQLKLAGMTQVIATNCILTELTDKKIELTLSANHATMLTPKLAERIEQALQHYFNKPIKLNIKIATADIETPAKQQQQEHAAQHAQAAETIKNDVHVKKMIDLFGATLDENSIEAV